MGLNRHPDIFISPQPVHHIAVVNSKALELAGITKDTPDPQGGRD